MKLPRRHFLHLAAGTAALPAVSRIARAQAYPSRPVRIIVGQAAGSGSDTAARLIAQWLSERLGQQFDKLNSEINAALADPKIKVRLAELGSTILAGSPVDFGKLIAEDTEKWGKVVKFAGIKPE